MNKREVILSAGMTRERSSLQPTADEIAARAYEIFVERGATHGNELEDWLQAERELTERNGHSALRRSVAAD